ncbi:aminotransferase class IV family protein [Nioella sp.]|uniref:aminotransferase class IV family protein n=1 Tax=Nioella sp. TaxID=1912091 RepID=UPI003B51FC57
MESPFPEPVPAGTRLIETFGWWPGEGVRRLDRHLARMGRSAGTLGFPFHEDAARERVAGLDGQGPLRCRLTLGSAGDLELIAVPLPPAPDRAWRVAIHPERLRSDDPWLGHKTTNRALYDQARAALPDGVDEYLFLNERGEVCEGTITNIFVTLEEGQWVTPPRSSGLLPGVLREELLASGEVEEAPVTLDMLRCARAVTLGNSLRGEIPAQLLI